MITDMKTMKRFSISVLSLLLAVCLLSACKSPQPAANANRQLTRERVNGVRGGSLTYRLTSPPKTFNPLLVGDESALIIAIYLLNSRLIDFDHDTQKYIPAVAESWKRSDDGRSVDLTLREGLKFSDGQPITSDDIAFTMRALYDPRTNSQGLKDSLLVDNKPLEVSVSDARNFRIAFPEVVASVENYLFNIPVMPRHALEESFKQGKISEAASVTADPQSIITSGPFTVAESRPAERIVLQRNPNYWKKDAAGTSLPYLDTLTLDIVADQNNAFTRLNQNSVDIIDRIRSSDYATLAAATDRVRGFDLGAGLGTDHIWFNLNDVVRNGKPIVDPVKAAWFSDVRFRRAVAHAIDRETIAKSTLQGLASPLYSFVSPGNRVWSATDLPRPDYNLEKARALLQESGFAVKGSAESPELYDARGNRVEWTLIVPVENEPRKLEAAVIQEDLAKLGMKVQVAPIEFQALTERWSNSFDYDAVLLGILLTDLEPSSYASLLVSSSAHHQWRPKQGKPATEWEARIDELFAAQAKETDTQKRLAQFREIQNIMLEQMPLIPVVSRHVIAGANTRIGNYRPSPIIPFSLWNADELFVRQ